jgi:hypothetical protein
VRGCLFTIVLAAILLGLLVVVGLPAVAAGVLTGAITAAGLQSDDTTVTVRSDPPTDLIGLHADHVRVLADDATFRGMAIDHLDLTLDDVAIVDRTVGGVDGTLTGVTVPLEDGSKIRLDQITIAGEREDLSATTVVPKAQVQSLISDAIEQQAGIRPTAVVLTAPDRLLVKTGLGVNVGGQFVVTPGGDLVVHADGPLAGTDVVLLHGGQDVPLELTGARVTPDGGLRLTGKLAISLLG